MQSKSETDHRNPCFRTQYERQHPHLRPGSPARPHGRHPRQRPSYLRFFVSSINHLFVIMNELRNLHYSKMQNHDYSKWFQETHYNGKTLTETERKEFIYMVEKIVSHYVQGLPLIYDEVKSTNGKTEEFYNVYNTVSSVLLFVVMIMIDCMTVSKLFLLSNNDYERRLLRGKIMVINNEGFKNLYGFNKSTIEKSEWFKLQPFMRCFSEEIQHQYDALTAQLDEQSKKDSWWKNERDLETHLDAVELYESRCEEIIESKVMLDNLRLYSALDAVSRFLTNIHGCLVEYLQNNIKQTLLDKS